MLKKKAQKNKDIISEETLLESGPVDLPRRDPLASEAARFFSNPPASVMETDPTISNLVNSLPRLVDSPALPPGQAPSFLFSSSPNSASRPPKHKRKPHAPSLLDVDIPCPELLRKDQLCDKLVNLRSGHANCGVCHGFTKAKKRCTNSIQAGRRKYCGLHGK